MCLTVYQEHVDEDTQQVIKRFEVERKVCDDVRQGGICQNPTQRLLKDVIVPSSSSKPTTTAASVPATEGASTPETVATSAPSLSAPSGTRQSGDKHAARAASVRSSTSKTSGRSSGKSTTKASKPRRKDKIDTDNEVFVKHTSTEKNERLRSSNSQSSNEGTGSDSLSPVIVDRPPRAPTPPPAVDANGRRIYPRRLTDSSEPPEDYGSLRVHHSHHRESSRRVGAGSSHYYPSSRQEEIETEFRIPPDRRTSLSSTLRPKHPVELSQGGDRLETSSINRGSGAPPSRYRYRRDSPSSRDRDGKTYKELNDYKQDKKQRASTEASRGTRSRQEAPPRAPRGAYDTSLRTPANEPSASSRYEGSSSMPEPSSSSSSSRHPRASASSRQLPIISYQKQTTSPPPYTVDSDGEYDDYDDDANEDVYDYYDDEKRTYITETRSPAGTVRQTREDKGGHPRLRVTRKVTRR